MLVLLVVLVPIIALFAWGAVFDHKRRRRHALTGHDVSSAARRARGEADARGGSSVEGGGGSF